MPSVTDIVQIIKTGKKTRRGVILLIGAGCSVSGGVPSAEELLRIIRKSRTYSWAYDKASEKTYQQCMALLPETQRRDLIGRYIDKAKVNWAHLAIAQLIKHGYVDKVLTTNFDPLLIKACNLVGEFPAVYDLAASKEFKLSAVPEKAIVYLHGQRHGFNLLNTKQERRELSSKVAPVFESLSAGKTWIVIGYSGEERDPVYNALAKIKQFDGNFYWVAYKDFQPLPNVNKLLTDSRNAYLVQDKDYDADTFLVELAKNLSCFPPDFIERPFTYLQTLLGTIKELPPPGNDFPFPDIPGQYIETAINSIEREVSIAKVLKTYTDLLKGDYPKVTGIKKPSPELRPLVAHALAKQGDFLLEDLKKDDPNFTNTLLKGENKYRASVQIKSDFAYGYFRWGCALTRLGIALGAKGGKYLKRAEKKFQIAERHNPKLIDLNYYWGVNLRYQATNNNNSSLLLRESEKKYRAAANQDPKDWSVFDSWGLNLIYQAKNKKGKAREATLKKSLKLLRKAEAIKPGTGSYNIARVYALLGKKTQAFKYLELAISLDHLPSLEYVKSDVYLANLQNHKNFKLFLRKLKSGYQRGKLREPFYL